MQELQANTEVKVRVGPFVDVGDGFTPQTDIGNPDTDLTGVDEAELLKHNGAGTVDLTSNAWVAITGCDGWYDLTLTTTDTNTEGMLSVVIQDDSDCLPVHIHFMVLAQAAYASKYGAKDSGYMDVDIKAVGGTATPHTSGKLHVLQGDGNAITAAGPTKTEMDNGHAAIVADTEDLQGNVDTMHDTDLPAVKTVVDAIQTDLGDFSGRTNNKSLLAVLGVPDVANKDLHTLLVTDLLAHGTHGLAALEALVDQLEGYCDLIDDATNGLAAIKAEVEGLGGAAMVGTNNAYTGTPPTVTEIQTEMEENGQSLLDTIRDELANATDGLSALKDLIDAVKGVVDAIPTTAMRGTDGAALASSWTAALATILANFSANRIGYLDQLDFNLQEAIAAIAGDATAANQDLIIAILTGEWEVIGNQFIIKHPQTKAVLYTFDLTQDGTPTEFNPDLRTPV